MSSFLVVCSSGSGIRVILILYSEFGRVPSYSVDLFILVMSMASRNSWARDWTQAEALTCAAAAAMPRPFLYPTELGLALDPCLCLDPGHCSQIRFLTHCAIPGTPGLSVCRLLPHALSSFYVDMTEWFGSKILPVSVYVLNTNTPERLMIFRVEEIKESEDSTKAACPWGGLEASPFPSSTAMPEGTSCAGGAGLMRLMEGGEMP